MVANKIAEELMLEIDDLGHSRIARDQPEVLRMKWTSQRILHRPG